MLLLLTLLQSRACYGNYTTQIVVQRHQTMTNCSSPARLLFTSARSSFSTCSPNFRACRTMSSIAVLTSTESTESVESESCPSSSSWSTGGEEGDSVADTGSGSGAGSSGDDADSDAVAWVADEVIASWTVSDSGSAAAVEDRGQ